jgi:NTP pyrophosphatase (non-canonical NTP hydrolase)
MRVSLRHARQLAEHFQRLTRKKSFKIAETELEAIINELGEVLIYLVNLADKCGIDALQAAHAKIEKNRAKFPLKKLREAT